MALRSRKRSAWKPGLALLVLLGFGVGSFAYGFLVSQKKMPPYQIVHGAYTAARDSDLARSLRRVLSGSSVAVSGRWARARGSAGDDPDRMQQLVALGYLQGYEGASGLEGVARHDPDRADLGLNVYSSGHEPAAIVVDMDGNELHRWSYDFELAFPDHSAADDVPSRNYWRRFHAFENGDLLAIHEGLGLLRLDARSKLLWARAGGFHHDLHVEDDGRIFVLSREARVIPRIHDSEPVVEDLILELDPDGETLRQISVLRALENSRFVSLLRFVEAPGDILHTNTLEIFDGSQEARSPLFARGNALVSFREIDTIAIIDLDREEVLWALSGQWKLQHQPTLLRNGRMLVFDNQGHEGASKVVEIDPLSQELHWLYAGEDLPDAFSSRTCGSNQRLANGNTLVTESDTGRAFEVTPDKKVVWEFYNPARAGEERELVATLFELVRLPSDYGAGWLSR